MEMAVRGHEMRRFLTAASVTVVLLIIAIVTYNIIDASLTLNNRERLAQDEVINEAKNIANLSLDKIYNPSGGAGGAGFGSVPQVLQSGSRREISRG